MGEKILRIGEFTGEKIDNDAKWRHYSGFEIETDAQCIVLGIDDGQSCCESWGYFMSHDDVADFIGATVVGVSIVDTALCVARVEREEAHTRDDGDIMFVNIDTDRGVLQFCAYNKHNGYYGHQAVVISKQASASFIL